MCGSSSLPGILTVHLQRAQGPFNYNAEGLSYDEETRDFTPGRLFGGIEGAQDGDLGFPNSGISDLPAAGKYAPIGPFGRCGWRSQRTLIRI